VFFNKYYKGDQNSINETQRSCSTHTKFCEENLNGTDHTGNLDTDGDDDKIRIFKKQDVRVWTKF